jgi:hypothetical protein
MSLIHDLVVKLKILRDHKAILEPSNSIGILLETLCFTQLQSSSDITQSNVRLLSGNDVFLDSWNEGYAVKSIVWNNLDTRLFWITTGCERLNCEMVALMLAARSFCHHVCLFRVIMDFQFIILY